MARFLWPLPAKRLKECCEIAFFQQIFPGNKKAHKLHRTLSTSYRHSPRPIYLQNIARKHFGCSATVSVFSIFTLVVVQLSPRCDCYWPETPRTRLNGTTAHTHTRTQAPNVALYTALYEQVSSLWRNNTHSTRCAIGTAINRYKLLHFRFDAGSWPVAMRFDGARERTATHTHTCQFSES